MAPREKFFGKNVWPLPKEGKLTWPPAEDFSAVLNPTLFLSCCIRKAFWVLIERLGNGFVAVTIGVIRASSYLISNYPSHTYSPPFCMESNEKYSLYIKKLTIVLCVVVLKMAILLAFSKI